MKAEMKLNTKDYYIHTYTQILVVTFKNKGELQKEASVQNVKKKKNWNYICIFGLHIL